MSLPRYCARKDCLQKFEPVVWNQRYCNQKCKRMAESERKRLGVYVPTGFEEQWELEEARKEARAVARLDKDEWILANKKFAMFDIESTQLDADFGRLICACVKPLGLPPKIFSTRKGDVKIATRIRDELQKYDYIVTYYGTGFDMPFLTTRLLVQGQDTLGLMRQVDMYYTSRHYLKLASNRQAQVVKSLMRKVNRTDVVGSIWLAATEGDKEAVQYVVDHCVADVYDLEEVFNWLVKFRNIAATPLRGY